MILPEIHQIEAAKICLKHVTKRYKHKHKCKVCQGHANTGVDDRGLVFPCTNCVNLPPVYLEWIEYVKLQPELKEELKDLIPIYQKSAGIKVVKNE